MIGRSECLERLEAALERHLETMGVGNVQRRILAGEIDEMKGRPAGGGATVEGEPQFVAWIEETYEVHLALTRRKRSLAGVPNPPSADPGWPWTAALQAPSLAPIKYAGWTIRSGRYHSPCDLTVYLSVAREEGGAMDTGFARGAADRYMMRCDGWTDAVVSADEVDEIDGEPCYILVCRSAASGEEQWRSFRYGRRHQARLLALLDHEVVADATVDFHLRPAAKKSVKLKHPDGSPVVLSWAIDQPNVCSEAEWLEYVGWVDPVPAPDPPPGPAQAVPPPVPASSNEPPSGDGTAERLVPATARFVHGWFVPPSTISDAMAQAANSDRMFAAGGSMYLQALDRFAALPRSEWLRFVGWFLRATTPMVDFFEILGRHGDHAYQWLVANGHRDRSDDPDWNVGLDLTPEAELEAMRSGRPSGELDPGTVRYVRSMVRRQRSATGKARWREIAAALGLA